MKDQKNLYLEQEADQWYDRNKQALEGGGESDIVVRTLDRYNLKPQKCLAIGCADGFRLEGLRKLYNAEVYGVEPSLEAVNSCKEKYPEVNIHHGMADNLEMFEDDQFDFILIKGVFCCIDRSLLFLVAHEITRVLQNKGLLMIGDFFPLHNARNPNHHITDREAFIYKQAHKDLFLSSGLYQLVEESSYNANKFDASDDYYGRQSLVSLRKDEEASYS